MAATEADPLIGQVLCGRFEILAPIAAGGMGKIYRAIQRPLDRLIALKVLNPHFDASKDPSFQERFFFEALMTAKLRHPNTVTLLDYGRTDEGLYFMALELLEGESLQQLLVRHTRLPWARALAIGAQVARSLREAHLLGLVHRDLKPGNIMVLSEGPLGDRVKVLDFGLVKCVESPAETPNERMTDLTEAGVVLGSPLYMAPEQARKEADVRSDIYSLGAVLFASISGRTPFTGKKPFELLIKHMHEEPPRLASLADVPKDVDELVMRCLAKTPEERFQSMDELLLAMQQAVREHQLGGLYVETEATSTPPSTPAHRLTEELPAVAAAQGPGAARARPPAVLPVRSGGAHRTPVRGTPVPRTDLHGRWPWLRPSARRALAWTAGVGAGVGLALLAVSIATGSRPSVGSFAAPPAATPPAHTEGDGPRDPLPAASDAVPVSLGLRTIEGAPRHSLDTVPDLQGEPLPPRRLILPLLQDALEASPQRGFTPLPSRPLFNRRANRTKAPTVLRPPKATRAPPKTPRPASSGYRDDPYE